MKPEEAIVETYLRHLGLGPVVFEPHGNVTPDFAVDGRIGVEVRRLNEHYTGGEAPEGLENASYAIESVFEDELQSLGAPLPADGDKPRCWWVVYRYGRPLPKVKRLRKELQKVLAEVQAARHPGPSHHVLAPGVDISVTPSQHVLPRRFMAPVTSDQNAGGLLMELYQLNLDIAVDEKWAKVSASPNQYPEWWLALVDTIGDPLDAYDRAQFLTEVSVRPVFDRVLLVSPSIPTQALEVPKRADPGGAA